MDFNNLIRIANKNEIKAEKQRSTLKPGLPPSSASKKEKEEKSEKGIKSASVRAFLANLDQEKGEGDKHRQKRVSSANVAVGDSKASACKPDSNTNDDAEIDLKHLFSKHDRRVARLPDNAIPNMMEVLKERERKRKERQREDEEERARKERELIKEREREREREREEKEKAQRLGLDSSKLKAKGKHSGDQPSDAGKSGAGQFKIPRKNKPPPPPLSYNALLALAAQKQSEPEEPSPPHDAGNQTAQNSKADRSSAHSGKDESRRLNNTHEKNVLLQGDVSKKHNTTKHSDTSNLGKNDRNKTSNSTSQLDKRKLSRNEQTGSHSDRSKATDKGKSNDQTHSSHRNKIKTSSDQGRVNGQARSCEQGHGRVQMKPSDRSPVSGHVKTNHSGASNGQVKSSERAQVGGHPKIASHRPSDIPAKSNGRIQTSGHPNPSKSALLSASNRTGNSASTKNNKQEDIKNGHKQFSKSVELSNANKQLPNSKGLSGKSGGTDKSSELNRANANISRKSDNSQKPISKDNEIVSQKNSSGLGSKNRNERLQLIKDFYKQCKQLKESGFISESLVKSLENELKNKLRALSGSNGSTSNPKSSGNSTAKASTSSNRPPFEKPGMRVTTSQTQQNPSKSSMSNKVADSNVGNNRAIEKEKRPTESKKVSAWDRIQAENKQFKPKPDPAVLKRRLEEYSDSEEEDDEDEDDYEDEDDDMDDFIDDGDDEYGGTDYSMYIRRMMKYDPTKYDDADFDDRTMVTSYANQLKEEAHSAREGRREDIEDMILEEEENKRKMLKKKTGAKRARLD